MQYEVDFLSVGTTKSGDAIALRIGNLSGPRNEQLVVVIDGGYKEDGKALVRHLALHYGTDVVDLVISTHPDQDHAAGLEAVLEECQVRELWMHQPWKHTEDIAKAFNDGRVTDNGIRETLRKSLEHARTLERIAERKGIPIAEPFAGMQHKSGRVVVVGPRIDYYEGLLPDFRCTPEVKFEETVLGKFIRGVVEEVKGVAEQWGFETLDDSGETTAENNSSAIVLVDVEDGFLLFTGDAGIPALGLAADVLDAVSFDYSKIRFIQAPHHGSARNVGPTILDRLLGPKLSTEATLRSAFVSVASDSDGKHPSKKVMNAFRRRGAPVHATAGSGKCHRRGVPDRVGWSGSSPLPFFETVED